MNGNRNSKIVPFLALTALLLLSSACGSTPTPTPTASPTPKPTAVPPEEPQGYGDHFSFEIPEDWRLVDKEGDASGSFSPEDSAILAVNEQIVDGNIVTVRGNVPPELFQYAAEMGLYLDWKGTRYQINDPATGQSTFIYLIEEVTPQ